MTISVSEGGTFKEAEGLWVSDGGAWVEVPLGSQAPTTTTLVSSSSSVVLDALYTLTARTTGMGGTVQFMKDSAAFGPPVPVDVDGNATLPDTMTTTGTYTYVAEYSGDGVWGPSTSNTITVTTDIWGAQDCATFPWATACSTANVSPVGGILTGAPGLGGIETLHWEGETLVETIPASNVYFGMYGWVFGGCYGPIGPVNAAHPDPYVPGDPDVDFCTGGSFSTNSSTCSFSGLNTDTGSVTFAPIYGWKNNVGASIPSDGKFEAPFDVGSGPEGTCTGRAGVPRTVGTTTGNWHWYNFGVSSSSVMFSTVTIDTTITTRVLCKWARADMGSTTRRTSLSERIYQKEEYDFFMQFLDKMSPYIPFLAEHREEGFQHLRATNPYFGDDARLKWDIDRVTSYLRGLIEKRAEAAAS